MLVFEKKLKEKEKRILDFAKIDFWIELDKRTKNRENSDYG